ncbi:hypothetical protein P3X46_013151 [Hevea brasiliensis]|uniref:Uncharacterized protein n=2 Tax=Hevea brasiliensis TaxID=3981 RepID=A0ABQ9M2L1_HEVBR|nr:hypothetical protein P3X46_013151 [Hevea brasiliensis]
MAEGVLFAVAEGIIGKLVSLAFQEIGLWCGVQGELDKIKNTVSSIRAVLLDAEKKQKLNEQVKDWLGKLKEVVYDMDELLDDIATEGLRQRVMDGNRISKEVRVFFSGSNKVVYGCKTGHKIKGIRERLAQIEADSSQFKFEVQTEESSEVMMRETVSSPPDVVIGREGDKNAIIQRSLASKEEGVSIFSIVGIGGLGKTTLAQIIFNDEQVESHFELKLWVCVSDPFEVKVVVKKILESATGRKSEDLELDTLMRELGKQINGRKFLLVLDDVWNENREKWDNLKKLLRGGARGSKIMITTRSKKVADITDTLDSYFVSGLSPSESWSLFIQIVFKGQEPTNPGLVGIGKEIVQKCAGVPLAIKTIGSLLYFKDPETEWSPFLKNELSKVAQNENYILQTLKLSYDHLPSHLKQCFAYCSLFPKDYQIDVKKLIQMWIAQGFIRPSFSGQRVEDFGLWYFKDLLWRSFFQDVQMDIWGEIESCKMHDLMHDLATSVSGLETTISNSKGESITEKTRHVLFDFDGFEEFSWKFPASLLGARKVRTFLAVNAKYTLNFEEVQLDALFRSLRSLLVLDLSRFGIVTLPPSIGKLKYVRYLNLSYNFKLKMLPNSITKLQNLEVLNLRCCSALEELPKDINKLVNLKILDCENCTNLTHMPCGLGKLTSLEELTSFTVAKESSISKHVGGLNALNRLNNLGGELQIHNLRYVKNAIAEFEDANLKEKHDLQSLFLSWGGSVSENSIDTVYDPNSLQRLQPHANLKMLGMHAYGGLEFPNWFSSLKNLVSIEIADCSRCQHLPLLDQIPSLKNLWLNNLTDIEHIDGGNNHFHGGGVRGATFFPCLKTLRLLNCPNLKGWWKKRDNDDNGVSATTTINADQLPQFACLSYLRIRNCPKLTWMPLFPALDDTLWLGNARLEPLEQTMKAKMMTSPSPSSSSSIVQLQPLSKLEKLEFHSMEDLVSLPEEWLQNFTSLQEIIIESCPRFASLRKGMHHLTSLRRLKISGCPQLKTYADHMDMDWPKGAEIRIDDKLFQRKDSLPLDDQR